MPCYPMLEHSTRKNHGCLERAVLFTVTSADAPYARVLGVRLLPPPMKEASAGESVPRANRQEAIRARLDPKTVSTGPPRTQVPPGNAALRWASRNLSCESNYELFNSNSISIRYWSWNYRGCWHQTCPPIVTH